MTPKKFRQAVKDKHGPICQRCGSMQGITVHHIIPVGRRPDLATDPNNGMCLCGPCHIWVHNHPTQATQEGYLKNSWDAN